MVSSDMLSIGNVIYVYPININYIDGLGKLFIYNNY